MITLSVQTGGIEEKLGSLDATYQLIHETGFEAADANIDHFLSGTDIGKHVMPEELLTDDEEVLARMFAPWKDAAEKYGVENYQAHAPFPSIELTNPDPEYQAKLVKMYQNMIKGSRLIGCGNLVIHPATANLLPGGSLRKEWDMNIDFYSRLIETARESGVTVLLENMFQGYHGRNFAGCCSDPNQAADMIDTLNEKAGGETFGFCVDTGHLLLLGIDIVDFTGALGKRIKAFHVHDNNGISDQHLAPYMGIQDWDRFVEALRRIGYDSTLSFETFNVWNRVDPEIAPYFLKCVEQSGRMFARKVCGS